MRWFNILNSEAFKNWLASTGSGTRLPQGNFKLDGFTSSMRKFNNAHTWLSNLNNTGTFSPGGRLSQAKIDLTSAGILNNREDTFTSLGKLTIDKWDQFLIPAGDDDYEIHRCLILTDNAFSLGNEQYIKYYNNWLKLRTLFSYEFLINNKVYLYLFSYLDKDVNDFNPYNLIFTLNIGESYFTNNIDWNLIKTYYNNDIDVEVNKYDTTISSYLSREGRSNLCIAFELLSKDEDERIPFINSLGLDQAIHDKLLEISNVLKPYTKATNRIYYGPPGTGKSYEVNRITSPHKRINSNRVEKVTFHPEYDYHSFVGNYKPTMVGTSISYQFVPQPFARIYVQAWKDLSNEYFLQIEEINRGNCAEIFGDLFQLLDRNPDYEVSADEDFKKFLQDQLGETHKGIENGKILLPPNLNLIATMNTSDQSLFPMDSAFKRRWNWIYTPIKYESDCIDISKDYEIEIDSNRYKWLSFLEKINKEIFNATESQDKQIGNWFVSPTIGNNIDIDTFVNKVIFYLWNDIFKEEDEYNIFKVSDEKADEFAINTDKKVITFEKFFENNKIYRIPILKYLFNDVLSVGQF